MGIKCKAPLFITSLSKLKMFTSPPPGASLVKIAMKGSEGYLVVERSTDPWTHAWHTQATLAQQQSCLAAFATSFSPQDQAGSKF